MRKIIIKVRELKAEQDKYTSKADIAELVKLVNLHTQTANYSGFMCYRDCEHVMSITADKMDNTLTFNIDSIDGRHITSFYCFLRRPTFIHALKQLEK